jgi:hypothetical protein
MLKGLFVRKLEAKTEPAWAFRRTGNAYDGIVPSWSQGSADVDITPVTAEKPIDSANSDDRELVALGPPSNGSLLSFLDKLCVYQGTGLLDEGDVYNILIQCNEQGLSSSICNYTQHSTSPWRPFISEFVAL